MAPRPALSAGWLRRGRGQAPGSAHSGRLRGGQPDLHSFCLERQLRLGMTGLICGGPHGHSRRSPGRFRASALTFAALAAWVEAGRGCTEAVVVGDPARRVPLGEPSICFDETGQLLDQQGPYARPALIARPARVPRQAAQALFAARDCLSSRLCHASRSSLSAAGCRPGPWPSWRPRSISIFGCSTIVETYASPERFPMAPPPPRGAISASSFKNCKAGTSTVPPTLSLSPVAMPTMRSALSSGRHARRLCRHDRQQA